MCRLNRLAIMFLILFTCFDLSIWIEIPLIILFGVCSTFADLAESDIKEKLDGHNARIEENNDSIAKMSKRLGKLEDQINDKGE